MWMVIDLSLTVFEIGVLWSWIVDLFIAVIMVVLECVGVLVGDELD